MRLVRLQLEDFLPYAHLDVDFEGIGQIAIVGHNGAGKSSLLDAVLWSLYGQARGRADQLIREGANETAVETTWHTHEGVVSIRRTRRAVPEQSSLTLTIAGINRTRHTIADTQTAIEELVGLPYRALLAGPVMVQGESDVLMSATPSERKEILVRLFELDRYQVYHDRAKELGADASLRSDVAAMTAGRLQEVVDEELPVRGLRRDAVDAISRARAEVDATEKSVTLLREHAVSLRERVGRAEDLRRAAEQGNKELDRAARILASLDAEVLEYRTKAEQQLPDLAGTSSSRLEELEIVTRDFLAASDKADAVTTVPCGGQGEYAACRFLVDAVRAAGRVPDLERQLLSLGGPKPLDEITTLRKKVVVLERETTVITERRAVAERWLAKEPEVRSNLEEQIIAAKRQARDAKGLLATFDADIATAQEVTVKLSDATVAMQQARGFLETNLADLARAEARLKAIDHAKAEHAEAREAMQTASREVTLYGTLARAFGRDGIPTLILENGIPLIEDRANEILARMTGGFAISLVTQRETKAGLVRDTLDVLVAADGRERPYSLLSGGERLRVDFALRVALSDVLVKRAGRAFETLFIDESFGSQDRQGREMMLEAIAAVADDFGLICVVSHVEDVTDRFDTRLVVEKDATGISSAEIVG